MPNMNKNQKKIIAEIGFILRGWTVTNDIDSPTHYGDIDENLMAHLLTEDVITEDETLILSGAIKKIFQVVQTVK